jgi:hypothetical protein
MKSSSRRRSLRSRENSRRRKSFLKITQRRLYGEKLESRELLAGDILHNVDDPFDTDNNGVFAPVDILHVINQLNQPTTAPGGESPGGTTTYFNDVNDDGFVSPIDALRAINEYNARSAEGAGDPLVRMRVTAVALDKNPTTGLDVPVTSIAKGTDYYLKVTVQDLRLPGGVDGDPNGVYAAYLDLLYQKGLTNVELEEIQKITFNNNPEGGTFTLTFDSDGAGPNAPQTTANITFTLAGGTPENTIAANIQSALDTKFGKNLFFVSPVSSGDPNRYFVRFMGAFADRNVVMMTANASGLTSSTAPPNPTITITEDTPGYTPAQYQADRVNPDSLISGPAIRAFRQAFRFSPQYDNDAGGANDGQISPFVDANRLDEAGNFAVGTATLGSSVRELFRVRMNSLDGGTASITGSVANMISPQDDTLVYGGGGSSDRDVVEPALIDIVNPPNVTITEPFSAIADTFNFTEFNAAPPPAAQSLTVKSNDTGALTGVTISAISTTSLSLGTLSIASGGNSINFVPLADVNGTATFTYTLRNATTGITDTATVTINISAVNDAPVNTVPGLTQTTPEETALVINGVSINDIDANETPSATMQVDLSVLHGTITLNSIPAGLVFSSGGNGTAAMQLQGSMADINTALAGFSYTPVLNYVGSDTFRIITSDRGNTGTPGPLTDNDTVAITVTPVNDAPTLVVPSNGSILEGDPLVITGTSTNDVDVASSPLKVTLSVTGAGTLTLGSTSGITFINGTANGQSTLVFTGTLSNVNTALGSYTYVPPLGDAGTQTVSITVNDQGATGFGGPLEVSGQFTVDVIPLVRPFARRDPTPGNATSIAAFTVVEGSSNTALPVLDNDLVDDPAGGPVTDKLLISATDPPHGTTSISGDVVLYTPDADFWGTDTFTYVMNQDVDGDAVADGTNSTGTVTVTITNVNDAPVAVNSSVTIDEDSGSTNSTQAGTPTIITLSVSDVDDNNNTGFVSTLTPTITGGPAHGTATVITSGPNTGKISYVPTLNYNGADSFTYTVSDGQGGVSGTATVSITINPVNDAPVAAAGTLTAAEEVLTNGTLVATDVDSPSLTYSLVSTANAHGTVTITNPSTGAYTYTSDLNYNGPASFTFKASDGSLDSNTASVTITVTPVNDTPVAVPDSYLVEEDTLLNADNSSAGRMSVRANDSDVDNATSTLTVSLESGPTHALTFNLNSNGTFTYQATLDYQGPDSFVYRLTDAGGLFSTATATITVTEKNDPPVAVNDSYNATEDIQLDVDTASGVRDGAGLDDDPDANNPNSSLTVVLVSPPTHSSVFVLNNDGSFSYKGAANYNGPDSFKYKLTDPFGVSSNTATVSINVAEVNDNPTAHDDGSATARLTLIKNTTANPFVDQEINVTANDDNSPDFNVVENITIISVGTPSHGTVTISGDLKKVLYTPELDYEGPDEFTYTISDGRGGTATATVFIEVVNFIPTDITGTVFADTNNNGVKDPNEKPLAGVKVTLQGHDDIFNIDFGADTDANAGNNVAALVVYTDVNGFYRFDAPGSLRPGMRPGTYSITEEQPAFMRDGIDTAGNTASLLANDKFGMVLPLLGTPGGVIGNNFAERGLDPSVISISDILSSSTGDGLILAINGSTQLWYTRLTGWTNLKSCTCVLSGDTSTATFTFTDMQNNVYTRTISQVGNPRFRIMGRGTDGSELIRLNGTAADFGIDLLAAGSQGPEAEGEADVPGDAAYRRGVDAVMAEVGNA